MEVRHIEEENLRPTRKTFISLLVGDIVFRDWYSNDNFSRINGAVDMKTLLLPDVGIVQSRSVESGKIMLTVKFLNCQNKRTNEVTHYLFNKNSTVSIKRIGVFSTIKIYSDINEFLECRFKHIEYLKRLFKTYISHLKGYSKQDSFLKIYFNDMMFWNDKLKQWFYEAPRMKRLEN